MAIARALELSTAASRRKLWMQSLGGLLLAAVLVLTGLYVHYDQEQLILTDQIRRSVRGSFIHLSDGAVHYELGGPAEAPTVVLVHGFSVPYYIWDPTFDALVRNGYRVLRYDLYGRGYSDRPNITYDSALFERQLTELLAGLKITDPIVIGGLSMGGPIAVGFAARHPEKVRAIILIDPAYSAGRESSLEDQIPFLGEYMMAVSGAPSLPEAQLDDFYHPERFPDWPGKYRVQMQYMGFRRALLSTQRNFSRRNQRPDFEQVGRSGLPVLLIWGKEDEGVPVETSDLVRQMIPQAEYHEIEEAAHLPHYERPEVVNPILLEFLKRTTAAQSGSQ